MSGLKVFSGTEWAAEKLSVLGRKIKHRWAGVPNASKSERLVDGEVTRTNLCRNPSFETDVADWVSQSGVSTERSTAASSTGVASMLVTKTSLNYGSDVVAKGETVVIGKTYQVSARFKRLTADPTPAGLLARGAATRDILTTLTDDNWQTLSYSFVATSVSLAVYVGPRNTNTAGLGVYVDEVLVEEAESLHPYFDGDSASLETVWRPVETRTTYEWTGTPDASASEKLVDGVVVATNVTLNPNFNTSARTGQWFNISIESGKGTTKAAAYSAIHAAAPGTLITASMQVENVTGDPMGVAVGLYPTAGGTYAGGMRTTSLTLQPGEVRTVFNQLTLASDEDGWRHYIPTTGVTLDKALGVVGDYTGDYFDGDTEPGYSWEGTPNASVSQHTAQDGSVVMNLSKFPRLRNSPLNGYSTSRSTESFPDGTFTRLTNTTAIGTGGMRLNLFGANGPDDAVPGQSYTMSADSRGDKQARVGIQWYDSAGSYIGGSSIYSDTFGGTGEWVRGSVTSVAPEGATSLRGNLGNVGDYLLGDTLDWRSLRIAPAGLGDTDYFDGDSYDPALRTAT